MKNSTSATWGGKTGTTRAISWLAIHVNHCPCNIGLESCVATFVSQGRVSSLSPCNIPRPSMFGSVNLTKKDTIYDQSDRTLPVPLEHVSVGVPPDSIHRSNSLRWQAPADAPVHPKRQLRRRRAHPTEIGMPSRRGLASLESSV